MGAFSDIFENALLNHIFHYDIYTYPRYNMKLALWIGDPTDTIGEGVEVTPETGYLRVEMAPGWWGIVADGTISNNNPVVFQVAISPWGTVGDPISHFVLFNMFSVPMFHGPLAITRVVDIGQVAVFPTGAIIVTLD